MGRQLPIESLESRRLFSIALIGHTLHVTGQLSMPNTITVGLVPGAQSVVADIKFTNHHGVVVDQNKTYPLSKVLLLLINGGNKNDTITIDQTNGSFPVWARVYMHNGNDTVTTGDERDVIYCGNGADVVNSGNGNDVIFGGRGADVLSTGNGNDYVRGGFRGHNTITTGSGDDTLVDPVGHDTMMAGSGADVFVVKAFRLDPVNDYDPTKDKLRSYVPPSNGGDNSQVENDILDYLLDSLI